jgi:hypothetical protein
VFLRSESSGKEVGQFTSRQILQHLERSSSLGLLLATKGRGVWDGHQVAEKLRDVENALNSLVREGQVNLEQRDGVAYYSDTTAETDGQR